MNTDKPTSWNEQTLRARRLAHDIAYNIVGVLIEKDEYPGVVVFALSMVMSHIMPIVMADSQGDFRAELKEVPKRIERGEEPKL
jgi:hypothetical protein